VGFLEIPRGGIPHVGKALIRGLTYQHKKEEKLLPSLQKQIAKSTTDEVKNAKKMINSSGQLSLVASGVRRCLWGCE